MAPGASVKFKAGETREVNKATTYKVFENSALQTATKTHLGPKILICE